ncbi:Trans-aconitate 2-methyltransferase [Micrococcus luteus]|uniref:class I SAM-dependent methyltransferase n=1 Tax=Micrococcus luteus TaxID=1270 RepID=UPI00055BCF94|nr:class I SAM-dependent methyltransferase [Micrococcus luteus]KWW32656.1 Trans-aconitate 2-methyltransferase [Micrococcus luteus]
MTPDDAAWEGLSTSSAAYGARAAEYTELLGTMDAVAEDDRLLVEAWADRVDGVLADVGCGPAHWTAHLASRGHEVTGIEPVEEFVTHAHRTHPEVRVEPGSFQTLPVAAFNGILGWYSIIHTPPVEMPALLERAHQALRPGGSLLLGFFASNQVEAFDHAVTTAWHWPVDGLSRLLITAGFTVLDCGTRQDAGVRRHGWIESNRS